jgi:hypothetical protein
MRKAITFAGLILVITILAPASALGKTKGTERPLKFTVSETNVVNLETFTNHYAGTEIASHAGKGTIEGNGSFKFSGFNTLAYQDSWVFTAPNGDEVLGTQTGTVTGGPEGLLSSSESVLVGTITGGTGRFRNASGTFTATYHLAAISSGEGAVTFSLQGAGEGSVSY